MSALAWVTGYLGLQQRDGWVGGLDVDGWLAGIPESPQKPRVL